MCDEEKVYLPDVHGWPSQGAMLPTMLPFNTLIISNVTDVTDFSHEYMFSRFVNDPLSHSRRGAVEFHGAVGGGVNENGDGIGDCDGFEVGPVT